MKRRRKGGWLPKKWVAYLATGAFLLFGLACVVVGFGLADGWDKILSWFTSDYAIIVYVALGFYGLGAIVLWWYGEIEK